jgi:hypothetical protein
MTCEAVNGERPTVRRTVGLHSNSSGRVYHPWQSPVHPYQTTFISCKAHTVGPQCANALVQLHLLDPAGLETRYAYFPCGCEFVVVLSDAPFFGVNGHGAEEA